MSIKEKDLQTINSLSDGDKLRVVTSEGNSRNVPASVVGSNANPIIIELVYDSSSDQYVYEGNLTFGEVREAYANGTLIYVAVSETHDDQITYEMSLVYALNYNYGTYGATGLISTNGRVIQTQTQVNSSLDALDALVIGSNIYE